MAGSKRHGMHDPKHVPNKSTEINRKARDKKLKKNSDIIDKYRAKLQSEN